MSQSKLKNFYITTKNGFEVRLRSDDTLCLTARLIEGLYVIDQVYTKVPASYIAKENLLTWHERLGHISVERLKQLRDSGAKGVQFSDSEISNFECEAWGFSRARRSEGSKRALSQ